MGKFLKLIKILNKNNKLNNSGVYIESEEDKEFQKYLESLSNSELEDLIKTQLMQFDNSDEGKAYYLKVSEISEEELTIEIREKLKIG